MRADPGVVGHLRRDVRPAGNAVDRVSVPLPAQHLAQRGPDTVGHDQGPAGDLEPLPRPLEHDRGDPVALTSYVDRADTVHRRHAGLDRRGPEVVVQLGPRDRGAPVRQRPARPRQQQGLTDPWARSPRFTVCARSQSSSPSFCSSATARGVSPSPHVLSRGNTAASASTTSSPARAAHAAAPAPAGPAPTTSTSADRGTVAVTTRFSQATGHPQKSPSPDSRARAARAESQTDKAKIATRAHARNDETPTTQSGQRGSRHGC